MTLEEKEKLIYETYKKRWKKWHYKYDIFVFDTPKSFSFDTPKSFSSLFSSDEVTFDSLWVWRQETGYTRVWTVCVSSSGVVFGQLYYFPLHLYNNVENALLVNNLEKIVCFNEEIKNMGFCNLTNDSAISKRMFDDFMNEYMKDRV